ncbi:MAG TPA: hypothetical protein EYG85_11490 [Crocinitomix sp.]|nr:hypothetical protein [Crocinitomix sp.]
MDGKLFYVVDAGGSKTDVAIVSTNATKLLTLKGYNPNRAEDNIFKELNQLIDSNAPVYFYGSGLSKPKNQIFVENQIKSKNVYAYSDVLGSARALLKHKKGIVSILGTGGVVAYFDGISVKEMKGGYGYLIDDYGGGLELSKIIISKWLNNDFNSNTSQVIEKHFSCKKEDFIPIFYQKKDINHLSKLCHKLPQLVISDKILHESVIQYFNTFIERHLLTLMKKYDFNNISFTGSIAHHFSFLLNESLTKYNFNSELIIKKPIYKLVDFHKE